MNNIIINGSPIKTQINSFDSTASPVRRRSLRTTIQKVDNVANDDDAERIRRRNAAEMERRLTSSGSVNSTSVNSPVTSKEQIGSLKEHFNTCLKMFTQNKINSQNAWNIHILDYMRSLVYSNTELRSMLQLASTSLDIGAKVYSLRVDDVHNEVLKLANVLTQINIKEKDKPRNEDYNDDDYNDDYNDDDNNEKDLKKSTLKIKKKKPKHYDLDSAKRITITENKDTLNGIVQKYNGLFTSSSIEENNNILNLNLFKIPGDRYELLVRTRTSNFFWSKGTKWEEQRNSQLIAIELDSLTTKSICPQFNGFAIDISDTSQEEVTQLSRLQDMLHHNENGIPIPDLDLENNDPNDDDIITDDYIEDMETIGQHGNIETAYITDMKPCNEPNGSSLEYSYRHPPVLNEEFNIVGVWAGPAHWKLKSLRKTIRNTTSCDQFQNNKTQYKKTKAAPENLNFDSCNLEDLKKKASRSEDSVKHRLTRKLVINTFDYCLLPENLHINYNNLITLNLKKDYKVPIQSSSNPVDNLNVSTYVYDNPNDNEYCNKTLVDVGWDAEGGNVSHEDGMDNELPLNQDSHNDSIHDDDLIAAPDMVPQNFVNYARRAKKMDMKRLKSAMWEELTSGTTIENINHDKHMEVDVKIRPTTLSEIYKKLPNKISTLMMENLSSPLAYVALLHLCNEHDLKLITTPDLSDILIQKD